MNRHIQKLNRVIKGRVLVCIDAANLEQSAKSMFVRPEDIPENLSHLPASAVRWAIDYRKLNRFFSSAGNLVDIRFYTAEFDNAGHHRFRYFMNKTLGFKLITKPLKEYEDHTPAAPHQKANFDVEIVADTIFGMDDFDTLVLFSGDSDFEYLIRLLKGQGKIIIGFSRTGHIAKELPLALSHYFDILSFKGVFLRVEPRIKREGVNAKDPRPNGPGSRR